MKTGFPDPKPCPCCGCQDLYVGHTSSTELGVQCRSCGLSLSVNLFDTGKNTETEQKLTAQKMSVLRWNRRTPLDKRKRI